MMNRDNGRAASDRWTCSPNYPTEIRYCHIRMIDCSKFVAKRRKEIQTEAVLACDHTCVGGHVSCCTGVKT